MTISVSDSMIDKCFNSLKAPTRFQIQQMHSMSTTNQNEPSSNSKILFIYT